MTTFQCMLDILVLILGYIYVTDVFHLKHMTLCFLTYILYIFIEQNLLDQKTDCTLKSSGQPASRRCNYLASRDCTSNVNVVSLKQNPQNKSVNKTCSL